MDEYISRQDAIICAQHMADPVDAIKALPAMQGTFVPHTCWEEVKHLSGIFACYNCGYRTKDKDVKHCPGCGGLILGTRQAVDRFYEGEVR